MSVIVQKHKIAQTQLNVSALNQHFIFLCYSLGGFLKVNYTTKLRILYTAMGSGGGGSSSVPSHLDAEKLLKSVQIW